MTGCWSGVGARMDITVTPAPAASRYEIRADGELVGFTNFLVRAGDPEVLVFTHTEVQREGEGLGSALVRAALDDARGRPARVVPQCPFVAAFIERHPDYADLVVPR